MSRRFQSSLHEYRTQSNWWSTPPETRKKKEKKNWDHCSISTGGKSTYFFPRNKTTLAHSLMTRETRTEKLHDCPLLRICIGKMALHSRTHLSVCQKCWRFLTELGGNWRRWPGEGGGRGKRMLAVRCRQFVSDLTAGECRWTVGLRRDVRQTGTRICGVSATCLFYDIYTNTAQYRRPWLWFFSWS